MTQRRETATLGGGCFWCLEAVYEQLQGVEKVVSGYSGGHAPNPTYKQVCSETTGHAEVVQVTFDPDVVSYREILEVFFTIHDPTTPNRQGADEGTQYRSAIFFHSPGQERVARQIIAELTDEKAFDDSDSSDAESSRERRHFRGPIVTEVEPFREFFPAEGYHQGYYRNNPGQGYCVAVIRPKLQKFRKAWTAKLKPSA